MVTHSFLVYAFADQLMVSNPVFYPWILPSTMFTAFSQSRRGMLKLSDDIDQTISQMQYGRWWRLPVSDWVTSGRL